jgi:hypothetical protein
MAPNTGLCPGPAHDALTDDLVQDLCLDTLWSAMARGEEHLFDIAKTATLTPLTDPATIAYRQGVLADCLRAPQTVRALYDLAAQAVTEERKLLRGMAPQSQMRRSLRVLELLGVHLRRLREFAGRQADGFTSDAFTQLFTTIRTNVDDDFLRAVTTMIGQLQFEHGIVATARFGDTGDVDFRLHEPPGKGHTSSAYKRLRKSNLTHTIVGHDDQDWRAMAAYRDRLLADIANATARSADHVTDFFVALRDELGFYVGCLNLAETLAATDIPLCLPEACAPGGLTLSAIDLRDPSLALCGTNPVVGNDVTGDAVQLVMVTGANRGGKTTLLRSLGVAQLMMQCGMFVCAQSFTAAAATSVHTHFTREEDHSMISGKLDEELARMSAIADQLTPAALLLCNESFMSTNDREGTEIASEVLHALVDLGIRVVFVTHLHTLAHQFHTENATATLFLTATPTPDGNRSFRLTPDTPSGTAHATDLANRILGLRQTGQSTDSAASAH